MTYGPTEADAVVRELRDTLRILRSSGAPLASMHRQNHGETAAYRAWLEAVAKANARLPDRGDEG